MSDKMLLNPTLKKVLKIIHILSVSAIFGGVLSLLALLLVKQNLSDSSSLLLMDFSIFKIFMLVVTTGSFVLVATSVAYELFTEWGILRFFWIIVKWGIVLTLFAITWIGLGPAISGMTSLSDAGLHITAMNQQYSLFNQKALLFLCLELILLTMAFVLSIIKPWGKRVEKKVINRKEILYVLVPVLLISLSMLVMQSISLNKIRNMPIEDTNATQLKDGVYYGEAEVGNYIYKINVKVVSGAIVSITSVDPRQSPYVTYAEGVFKKIIRDQNANTDAISGATTTSKAYMKAVENALKQAGK